MIFDKIKAYQSQIRLRRTGDCFLYGEENGFSKRVVFLFYATACSNVSLEDHSCAFVIRYFAFLFAGETQ